MHGKMAEEMDEKEEDKNGKKIPLNHFARGKMKLFPCNQPAIKMVCRLLLSAGAHHYLASSL